MSLKEEYNEIRNNGGCLILLALAIVVMIVGDLPEPWDDFCLWVVGCWFGSRYL